jgi:hypothetical protein
MARISRIDAYLGEFKNVLDMVGKVVLSVFADLGTIVQPFAALTSSSHTLNEINTYATWLCKRHSPGNGAYLGFERVRLSEDVTYSSPTDQPRLHDDKDNGAPAQAEES